MILQEINHKMPIYKDCTLGEMLGVGAMVFFVEIIVLSLLTRLFFGLAVIGIALTLMSFFHITKYALSQLQKVKYGKPYGYYQHFLLKKLAERGFIGSLYITRIGKWSVRRVE
jgi:conjugative transfer region protein (TIGR03750 family)